jgi:predicted nucleic acid-binding Zn ribbon protein
MRYIETWCYGGDYMIRYEFVCDDCGFTKTVDCRRIADRDNPVPCEGEHTGTPPLMRRKIGNGGFALKGEGWYKDGYSKPDPGKGK